jgi:hypothetical protein
MLTDATIFRAAVDRHTTLTKQIAALEGRLEALKEDELIELGRLSLQEHRLGKSIAAARRAWWKRGEAGTSFKEADQLHKSYQALVTKAAAYNAADQKAKAARKALADAIAALPPEGPAAKALSTRLDQAQTRLTDAKTRLAELEQAALEGARSVSIPIKTIDRKTRQEVDRPLAMWLPPKHQYIRGVVIAHPMITALANSTPMRLVAAKEGLALMVYDNFSGSGQEALARVDGLLEKFAAVSGHPELKGAPLLLGGLSASVLGTRDVACAVPERIFGIVHAAGGNMQQMPEDGRGMVQVPFIAHNGEFEWATPIGGMRPEYGKQTQWIMIREQMLRLWRNKHEHRMTLVVVPGGNHGDWDLGLTTLFVRKAVQYRLPREKRDGSTPAKCTPLPANSGWLTDADLDHPKYEPAPYDSYKGDKNNAFWHFDQEMAQAVYEYHRDKFLLPDPSKIHPVPAEWPANVK